MTDIEWSDDEIEIIERNYEALENYGLLFGESFVLLTPEHIKALQAGKVLAFNNGEYSTFLGLKPEKG